MSETVVLGGLSPHPAILVPDIGRGEEKKASATIKGLKTLAQEFVRQPFETLVIITPHGPAFSNAFSIRTETILSGDLGQFGAGHVGVSLRGDAELAEAIFQKTREKGISTVWLDEGSKRRYRIDEKLDHGVVVPLWYLVNQGFAGKLVVINAGFLPYRATYEFGKCIKQASFDLGRRVAVLASGDLSHRLTTDAPSGYHPRAGEFDDLIVNALKSSDVSALLSLDRTLVEDAAQCGLRPIIAAFGALDSRRLSCQVFSYEGPYGVGYCTAAFYPQEDDSEEPYPVKLARETVETFIKTGKSITPENVPEGFREPKAAFVTLYVDGRLRGCIGTVEPVHDSLAEEIVANAISSATRDPRFVPVRAFELGSLQYSVDVLAEPEKVEDVSALDPLKYGVICEKGRRRGLLLPNLEGVDTPKQQVSIAKQKAGIKPWETGVKLYRFEVKRYR